MDAEKLEAEGKKFAEQKLNQICRPKALDKIRWHQEQGHTLVLVSASVETYLQPCAMSWASISVAALASNLWMEKLLAIYLVKTVGERKSGLAQRGFW